MKRQTSQELAARRREVVSLAHKVWSQAAIASHLKIPQGTVSRALAAMREFWRDFPVYDFEKVRFGRFDAHQGPLCASARITVEPCVSPSGIRTFNDFPINASEIMEFENAASITTQAIAGQSEAATSAAGGDLTAAEKYAHKRIFGRLRSRLFRANPPFSCEPSCLFAG
jgi:hypothetical protein